MGCTSSTPQSDLSKYNKRAKRNVLNPSYEHIQTIFEEITSSLQDKTELQVLDIGSGVGTHLPLLSSTFSSDNKGTLICIDPSPQCLQFVRQVSEKDKHAKNQNIKFIQNTAHSLCLTPQYETDVVDLCFMAFVLQHISSKNKARETILKEIYQSLKPKGIFVVFESNNSAEDRTENKMILQNSSSNANKNAEDTDSDSEWNGDGIMLEKYSESHELIEYVESFGFHLSKQILQNELEKHWIFVFRK